jgi:hypothetical protein
MDWAANDLSILRGKALDFGAALFAEASGSGSASCVLVDRKRKGYCPCYFDIEA